jgi:hypothetical protein
MTCCNKQYKNIRAKKKNASTNRASRHLQYFSSRKTLKISKNFHACSASPYEGPLQPDTGCLWRGKCSETSFFHSVPYFTFTAPALAHYLPLERHGSVGKWTTVTARRLSNRGSLFSVFRYDIHQFLRLHYRQWKINKWVRDLEGMILLGENKSTERKTCPSAKMWQKKLIAERPTWNRPRASAVTCRRLTAWAMATQKKKIPARDKCFFCTVSSQH